MFIMSIKLHTDLAILYFKNDVCMHSQFMWHTNWIGMHKDTNLLYIGKKTMHWPTYNTYCTIIL